MVGKGGGEEAAPSIVLTGVPQTGPSCFGEANYLSDWPVAEIIQLPKTACSMLAKRLKWPHTREVRKNPPAKSYRQLETV